MRKELSGFEISDAELNIVNNIIDSYLKKIDRFIKAEKIQLRLKLSQHEKSFLHEISGKIITNKKIFNAKVSDRNLFYAVASVLEKLLHEIEHFVKKK